MTIRKRAIAAALTMGAVVLLGRLPLIAQEPPAVKPADPAAKKKTDPARRVPDYFGQIALTTEQRAAIYGIQGKHQEKIQALQKQIADERAAMLAECEATLTETQRKLLENLRKAAAEPAPKPAEVTKTSK